MQNINESQKIAIYHGEGPMLVLAGPGSGKTFVITRRIKHLIESNLAKSNQILVITFTKAAALEMKERTLSFFPKAEQATFATFHSIFFQILKKSQFFSEYTIATEQDKRNIVRTILFKTNTSMVEMEAFITKFLKEISFLKNTQVNIELSQEIKSGCMELEQFQDLYRAYQAEMKHHQKMDFDDIIRNCYVLLSVHPEIANLWKNKFKYLLVDEFQDTNEIQYRVLRLLVGINENLFVVGDDDQSIYGFRGSKPDYMKQILVDFPKAKQVFLDKNYRSTKSIVAIAQKSISNNKNRFDKKMEANNEMESPIGYLNYKNRAEQAKSIVEMIKKQTTPYNEVAILFRTLDKAFLICELLRQENIPVAMKERSNNIYENKIFLELLAYLRFAFGEKKRQLFLQFMNHPMRYLSRSILTNEDVIIDDLISGVMEDSLPFESLKRLKRDFEWIRELDCYGGVHYIFHAMGYWNYLMEETQGDVQKVEDLKLLYEEILTIARAFSDVPNWLRSINEITKMNSKNTKEASIEHSKGIQIMTYHASKGLEFETVFLPDLNKYVVPHRKAVSEEEIEEERRMFYVAMTRAKQMLYLLSVVPEETKEKGNRSLFLEELFP